MFLTYDVAKKKFVGVNAQPKLTVVSGTGHRELGTHTITSDGPIYNNIREHMIELLLELNPTHVISGMAVGFDMALADAACQARIPFTAAVPFVGHGERWNRQDRSKHETLLGLAAKVVHTSQSYTNAGVYVIRDRWMVDNSEFVFAFYDGRNQGGTKLTVDYAHKQNRVVVNVWSHKNSWV